MYISCALCFQSGGRGATTSSTQTEVVVASGHQIHWMWKMEIVSNILCIVLSEVVC